MKNANKFAFKLHSAARQETTVSGDIILIPAVYSTVDYDRLEYHKANRSVKPAHVKKMMESILQNGLLRFIVVVCLAGKYIIADGQHLFEALRQMGVRVYFLLKDVADEYEAFRIISQMNSTQKGWTLGDFINGWAFFFDSYGTLQKMIHQYRLTDAATAMVLGNMTKSTVRTAIKAGEFKAYNEEHANLFLQAIDNFYSHLCPTGLARYSYASEGLISFINANGGLNEYLVNEQDFLRKAVAYNNEVAHYTSAARKDDMERFLNGALNYIPAKAPKKGKKGKK